MSNNDFTRAILDQAATLHEGPFSAHGRKVTKVTPDDGRPAYNRYHYSYNEETYLVHQPWAACPFCYRAWKEQKLTIAEGAAYRCPHTDRDAYLKVRQQVLDEGFLLTHDKHENLKSGAVLVTLAWLVPRAPSAGARPQKKGPTRL